MTDLRMKIVERLIEQAQVALGDDASVDDLAAAIVDTEMTPEIRDFLLHQAITAVVKEELDSMVEQGVLSVDEHGRYTRAV